jgi:hypothetical protein
MRRMSVLLSVITVVLLGLFAIAYDPPGTTAQEATPGATAGHPFVGAWRMNNPAMPEEAPILVVLHADGTYVQTEADGSVGIGSWVATGERSGGGDLRRAGHRRPGDRHDVHVSRHWPGVPDRGHLHGHLHRRDDWAGLGEPG